MMKYYKPSGKFSVSSFIYFVLMCIIALPLLGLIYAYCIWYIPFPYINFLITAGFGFVIGLLVNYFVVEKGKVRNVYLASVFGILAGLIGLYFHWAVWADLVINAGESYGNSRIGITMSNIKILDVFVLAANPSQLFQLIGEINQYGTWGIKGMTPSGVFLYILWAIEFIIVIVISIFTSSIKAHQPFCENSNEWFEEKELQPLSYIANPKTLTAALEKIEANAFEGITKAEDLDQDHSVFTLYTSKHNENYLSIINKKSETDDKGKIDFDSNEFLEYIKIDQTLKDVLLGK